MITADAILFRDIKSKDIDALMLEQCFQCEFCINKVKYARKTITRLRFIALNCQVPRETFKQSAYQPRVQTVSLEPHAMRYRRNAI